MVDITITPASVIAGTGTIQKAGTSGATIVAGNIVYLDPTDSKYKLADSDAMPAGVTVVYLALNGASDGQPITVLQRGDVALGAVLTAGARYYLSETAGGVQPEADLGVGEDVILLGLASDASTLQFNPQNPGVTL